MRVHRLAGAVVLLVAGLAGAFGLGRASAPHPDRDYAGGLKAGRAAGLAAGREQQAAVGLPGAGKNDARAQFRAGYRAGADDIFDGYDGGWVLGHRYAVVLGPGVAGADYRIIRREELP